MDAIACGQLIRQRRRQLNLSQRDLAKLVGCHMQTIDKIERAEIKFSRYHPIVYSVLGITEPLPSPKPAPKRNEPMQHETAPAELRDELARVGGDMSKVARRVAACVETLS